MRFIAPFFFALILFLFGRRLGGLPVGLLLGIGGAVSAYMLGKVLRGRTARKAPPAPAAEAGESPRLHGPVQVHQAQGAQECWAYLSDRRLSLLPLDGAQGVELRLAELTEIRPLKRRFGGSGDLAVVGPQGSWRLRVPSQARWLEALRGAARSSDGLS